MPRLKILLGNLASVSTCSDFLERAFRRDHDVISFGPVRDAGFMPAH
jgi:hypothetical protein